MPDLTCAICAQPILDGEDSDRLDDVAHHTNPDECVAARDRMWEAKVAEMPGRIVALEAEVARLRTALEAVRAQLATPWKHDTAYAGHALLSRRVAVVLVENVQPIVDAALAAAPGPQEPPRDNKIIKKSGLCHICACSQTLPSDLQICDCVCHPEDRWEAAQTAAQEPCCTAYEAAEEEAKRA